MWQRVQSIFIGIVILSLILSIIYPVWEGVTSTIQYKLYPIYFLTADKVNGTAMGQAYIPYCLTAILTVAAITVAITEFRRFDNILLQVKLGTLNSLLLAGVIVCDVVFSGQLMKQYPVVWVYGLSIWLVGVAVVCNWLAIRFIRRDEKILRDSNRIR